MVRTQIPARYLEQARAGKVPGKTREQNSWDGMGVTESRQVPGETLPQAIAALARDARILIRRDGVPRKSGKCVVYWMQRAQRALDNPALDAAVAIANELDLPLVVFFSVVDNYPNANLRHYYFMQQGFADIEDDLAERGIGFVLRRPPHNSVEKFLTEVDAAILVGDENPIRATEQWRQALTKQIEIPYWTVDADVIVPSRLLEKAQYAAHTARPRLMRMLADFLHPGENANTKRAWKIPRKMERFDFRDLDITDGWKHLDRSVGPVDSFTGGTHAASNRLKHFIGELLHGYAEKRNHPELDHTSRMSPYLHFGHIGPITLALAANKAAKTGKARVEDRDSFFNEMFVWRELAINLVIYNPHYDSIECAENWARQSLKEHEHDQREHVYTLDQLRKGETYDELWNAAQMQMVNHGWMHNYMRMYWAKKILEWSPKPQIAYKHAVILNDTYFLDGRDPNGYAGIAWSIAGKFDRAWFERPVFGKIRYMSGASTGKKFNSKAYIAQNLDRRTGGDKQQPTLWDEG